MIDNNIAKELEIFSSLTGRQESFFVDSDKVGVYVCGITPYDITHLGHAFTYTFFDVVIRYLRHLGFNVRYVQNLTDIDDDILKKAKEKNKDWRELGEENTQKFLEDMKWLNNLQPDFYPRATDHISEIVSIIDKLKEAGVAYEIDGNVYFEVGKDKNYGKLSRLSKEEMLPISAERGNDIKDPNKKDPLDFVLWQRVSPGLPRASSRGEPFDKAQGEPSWSSPWGPGRPGWHIECSAMSMKYLGETVDIYGGGSDLIYPHHESSIAQSEAATGKQFAKYWMHTGMVRYQGEKMSKSLGNLICINDLKKKYDTNTVRMYLLSHHYRTVFEFQEEELEEAQQVSESCKNVWLATSYTGESLDVSMYKVEFYRAMNGDFNTPAALKVLKSLARDILDTSYKKNITDAKVFLNTAFNILGLTVEYNQGSYS